MDFKIIEEDRFKYVEHGEGRVLLLLHGLFGALSNFSELIQFFSKSYKVVIPILPLYEMPVLESSVNKLTQYVRQFILHKSFDSVTLIGNSLGGHIALLYSLEYPKNVEAMVLTGSSGLFENSLGDTFPRRGDYEYVKTKTASTFFNPQLATKELVDEVFDLVNDREKLIRILKIARSAIRHNVGNDLHKITLPTLLIWGKEDTITPSFVGEDFNNLLPNSELYFIKDCGHAPMMEQPDEFNQLLNNFLLKLPVL